MKMSRRILSLVLAAALLIACGITGLVLPVSAASANILEGGDFETANTTWWDTTATNNIVEDPDNAENHCVKITTAGETYAHARTQKSRTYIFAKVTNGKTYKVTFNYKHDGNGDMFLQFRGDPNSSKTIWVKMATHSATAEGVAAEVANNKLGGDPTGQKYYYSYTWSDLPNSNGEWKTAEVVFTLINKGSSSSQNTCYYMSFGRIGAAGTTYFDNVSLVSMDAAAGVTDETLNAAATYNGKVELSAAGSAYTTVKETVAAGTQMTVKVTPDDGYVMVPGSLKYTTTAGNVKVLNKAESGFGVGDGDKFTFTMPEDPVLVTADFAEAGYSMSTIGTSVHYTDGVADGIRFLTRLNVAGEFDATADALTLGGQEVAEIGTLLKRGEVETLTLEDMETAPATGDGKMWKAVNYSAEAGIYKVDDYTGSYLDFATVMMTTVTDRTFTAVGYITFADGTTVYSNGVQVDSIASAEARM